MSSAVDLFCVAQVILCSESPEVIGGPLRYGELELATKGDEDLRNR